MKEKAICCVFNYPSHYNYAIYQTMGKELGCEFFFFDSIFQDIKSFDTSKLTGFQKNIHTIQIGFKGFLFHTGIRKIFNRKYTHYILTGSSTYLINWLIILYSKMTRKKVFLWCHGLHVPAIRWRSRIVAKLFFSHVDGLLMYNSYFVSNMIDIGCNPQKIFIIHNSLDTQEQSSIYKSLSQSDKYRNHFGNNDPVVIYIGRIQKWKRLDLLVNAISKLNEEDNKVNLVIVGGISDDNTLDDKVKELNLEDRVWFYGPSYDELENGQLLYDANVCVCPTQTGLTSIHSLTFGTPFVTSNNFENQGPEFEVVTDGVTGSFYREGDADDLAYHIWRWANVSRERREAIRVAARKTIESEWSVDYQINLLKRVL